MVKFSVVTLLLSQNLSKCVLLRVAHFEALRLDRYMYRYTFIGLSY